MATLALSAVGQTIGNALGGPIGGNIGRAFGAVAGAYIDAALFSSSGQTRQSRAGENDYKVTSSAEGTDIPRLYGRARVGGQVIWATHLRRVKVKSKSSGKGLSSGGSSSSSSQYEYYANFAVGLCEGPITRIGRVWADGEEIDLAQYTHRIHYGTEDQEPDSLIVAKEGADNAPAYRGLAYIVFEEMNLARFGERVPQLSFEVFRGVDDLEGRIRAVTLIPAAGEFIYETREVWQDDGFGRAVSENRHTTLDGTDAVVSLDQLETTLPNCGTVSLFVTWFGTDLRCGECQIIPKIEEDDKETEPVNWSVAGIGRGSASKVSTVGPNSRPAYGGTPSDASVKNIIQEMHARGLKVAFTPFMLMDIPEGNNRTDPYTGETGQPAHPWRGRITCHPAPGQDGSPDGTSAVDAQVNAFVSEYRDFILHYANLCAEAGGVEIFVIGTELRGMTWLRNGAGSYPFVTALKTLAADVAAILPGAKLTYAADWSEWFGHQPADGSGDVYFHLDPLWADANIDAIGIDNYWPLADWRDGTGHLDWQDGWRDPRELSYLKSNIAGGEGYDWYYASDEDRLGQVRTPITDGAYDKPWVFRYKDIRSWWENEHYNRPAGVEEETPTAWTPRSKPFWFMEVGCPAVDRGANQPNVFVDTKSSESFFPYFSRGFRDDLMQRRYLKAILEYFDPDAPGFTDAQNPESNVYAGRMVDPEHIFVYTWDARPYPAFPNNAIIWTDAPNWQYGHWISGRMGEAPLSETVRRILTDAGFTDFETGELTGLMQGYLIDRISSVRDMLNPLEMAFFFDTIESNGKIRFRPRGREDAVATLDLDTLVETSPGAARYELTRAQETELARAAKLVYTDPNRDYDTGSVEARMMTVAANRVAEANLPIVLDYEQAVKIAETWLHETWAAREKLSCRLPPSLLKVEPGDVITVTAGGVTRDYRVTELSIGEALEVTAQSIEPHLYEGFVGGSRGGETAEPTVFGRPLVAFLDLPLITGAETPHAGRLAVFADPFGGVAFYRSPADAGYELNVTAGEAATIGETEFDFWPGPTSRLDHGNVLRVRLAGGELEGVEDALLFNGANLAAVENADGEWEVFQFGRADLVETGVYDLSRLLRGQFGTEGAMRSPVAAGARFVLLDSAVIEAAMTLDERNLTFNWKAGPAPYELSHPAFLTRTRAFSGLGLRPYSPVHVTGSRDEAGDLTIAWVRRDRIGADSWDQSEIPMSETSEAYEVDILNGGTVVRTLTATSPSVVYTAVQQTADFGAPQSSVPVRVYQRSQTFGRGAPRAATV